MMQVPSVEGVRCEVASDDGLAGPRREQLGSSDEARCNIEFFQAIRVQSHHHHSVTSPSPWRVTDRQGCDKGIGWPCSLMSGFPLQY